MGRSGENASGTKKMSKMYGTKKRPEPNIFWVTWRHRGFCIHTTLLQLPLHGRRHANVRAGANGAAARRRHETV
jgi:hypothetical protein